MRLPDDRPDRRAARGLTALTLFAALGACASAGSADAPMRNSMALGSAYGPQADYPVLLGDPYTIDGVTFTPSETLNYDEVGYLVEALDLPGHAGAHHTLPVPSYVEVTSLDSGRTVLVRVERRGPMHSTDLLALSPDALRQLGVQSGAPVRVRRVNPPEDHRAALRRGEAAPLRMDTPQSLVSVLRRKLPEAVPPAVNDKPKAAVVAPAEDAADFPRIAGETHTLPVSEGPEPTTPAAVPAEFAAAFEADQPESEFPSEPHITPEPVAIGDGFVVQAAAFSTAERAARVADALGGKVTQSGRYFRVRTGPFASRGDAEASLAKVKAAGYTDARILTSG